MKCFLISKRVDVESLQKGQENTDQKLEINMSYLSSVWDPTKILSDLQLKTVKWYPKKESIKSTKMGHQAIAVPINAKLYHQHCI